MYADIVLPATSSFENTDVYTSYWHHYVQIQLPAIEAYGESKSNPDVFRLLAKKFGFNEECFQDSDEELIRQALDNPNNRYMSGITIDKLRENQFVKANRSEVLLKRLPTPSGKIELYSKKMEKDGYLPLPTFVPINRDDSFPYVFIPAPNHNFLNSTFSNNEKHISFEKRPKLHIHKSDANKLGLNDGDTIEIFNDKGSCILEAAVGDNVLPGVVVSQGLWADLPETNYFVNSLTSDRLSDMGGGATFFSNRVALRKA